MSRIDCIKHGEVECFRDVDGTLKCSVCVEEKKMKNKKEKNEESTYKEAESIMDFLFNRTRK